ncbi:phage tail protein [Providencia alcalifaciens]|uniref:Phage tail assembly chaperone n=1 Tax=Providencia alcalifaciens DSM 30120 TaxID=520999 RepID=B6XBS8_9GAMM|nr:phage tail assembly chaperone [Providencia alcalifaciens]ATG18032.1 phage tail protein [Providencia alcalifaciens]EEB47080.1 phage tail assembly chaperone [Providencia alcalifaciens DSM 30120]SQI33564.1 Phage tail assembly chaperone [Providencia alcalifaciens]
MASSILRQLALSPKNAFRSKRVGVPEWDGVQVILREPSSAAWLKWRELMNSEPESEGKYSEAEQAQRNLRADVVMFSDILLDEDKERVFADEDIDILMGIYGPVHARLLKQALDLMTTPDEAEKK